MKAKSGRSIADGAQEARISYERMWRRVLTGEVAATRIDGRWVIDEASFRRFINRQARRRQLEQELVEAV